MMVVVSLLLATAVVAAAPAAPPGQRRALVLDVKPQGVDPATAQTISEIVATAVAHDPALQVTSGADLRALMDVEASKRSMDCEGADSCLAELAGALGADIVVSGSAGKLGDVIVVTLSVYDAVAQASAAKVKVEDRDVAQLSPKIDAAVAQMLGEKTPPRASFFVPGVITASAGAAVLLAGLGVAGYGYAVQVDPKSAGSQKDGGAVAYPAGLVAAGAGGVALAVGVALLFVGD